jgi:hypothetical protein
MPTSPRRHRARDPAPGGGIGTPPWLGPTYADKKQGRPRSGSDLRTKTAQQKSGHLTERNKVLKLYDAPPLNWQTSSKPTATTPGRWRRSSMTSVHLLRQYAKAGKRIVFEARPRPARHDHDVSVRHE